MKRLMVIVVCLEALVLLGLAWARLGLAGPSDVTLAAPDAARSTAEIGEAKAAGDVAGAAPSRLAPAADAPATPGAVAADAATDDPLGIILFGRVTDTDGAPAADGGVNLESGRLEDDWANTPIEPGGSYRVAGLRPGRWRLTAAAEGLVTLERWIELDAAPRARRLDLVLARAWPLAVVILTADGQPLHLAIAAAQKRDELGRAEVRAVATAAPLQPGPIADVDQRGIVRGELGVWRPGHEYVAPGHEMHEAIHGIILLRQPPPCGVSAVLEHIALATTSVDAGQHEATLRVSLDDLLRLRATVRAQFIDAATGMPIAGLEVRLMGPGLAQHESAVKTDTQGRVVFAGVTPGAGHLHVVDREVEGYAHPVVVAPGGTTDAGVIRVARGHSIEVQVVDTSGTPVQVAIECLALDRAPDERAPRLSWRPDAEGRIRIANAPRGRVLIQPEAGSRAHAGWCVVDTTAGAVTQARFEVRPPARLRIVSDATENGAWSVVLRAGDVPVVRRGLWIAEQEVLVPTGSFVADVRKDGVVQRSAPLEIGERGAVLRVP